MMYYCEFLEDKNLIHGFNQHRIVSRYLIVNRDELPGQVGYKAKTIARVNVIGDLVWHKHREKAGLPLTEAEQKELMLQILKSETW